MLTDGLGTLGSALLVLAFSLALGHGILAACGRRSPSSAAPAVGLAAASILAWWIVRLPGHGWSALVALSLVSAVAAAVAARRIDGLAAHLRDGLPAGGLALALAAIPFLAEAHLGVLGTGFNVDMSQHLFAADWIAQPDRAAPGLFAQGYPLGPHALTVAVSRLTGGLPLAFSGLTIALVAIAAMTVAGSFDSRRRPLLAGAATLVALAYLSASLLAQGSFKELFEIAFLLGFVAILGELVDVADQRPDWRAGLPLAVLAAGSLYTYSAPGLAWLAGTAIGWATLQLLRHRDAALGIARRSAPALVAALAVLFVLAAPELDRIVDFGGSVGTVSESSRAQAEPPAALLAAEGSSDAKAERGKEPRFDDDLGNLFGQISPLEAFGVWPSGDFRVAPGDGSIPALVFYAGALLGALALALGVSAALRAGDSAALAALAVAAAIWLAARLASTPYTSAKALAVLGVVVMVVVVRGAFRPDPGRRSGAICALGLAFAVAAAGSSLLVLANAPVGPAEYTPGVRELASRFAGRPTLLLAPASMIADERGAEFFSWELREADPACVEPLGYDGPRSSIRLVVTVGSAETPFAGAERLSEVDGVTLWRVDPQSGRAQGARNGACRFN